ncbi:hypothetical protein [Streptomyces fagopyri]|uniref:hypothetical protein n=1 Tax=Streptomyces fagopyri TaxID=2662397 RepID=UPI0037237B62
MNVDFNGTPIGYNVHGDRQHDFTLPRNRDALPEKVAAALGKADAARDAEQKAYAKDGNDRAGHRAANEKLGAAIGDAYDKAAASSRARREHHIEEYNYAAAKFARAMGDAEAALQMMADHAQLAVNPTGVGFNAAASQGSKTVTGLRFLVDQMRALSPVPALDEEV